MGGGWLRPDKPPTEQTESLVLRDDGLEVAGGRAATGNAELAAAREIYRKSDYPGAQKAFHRIAENTKNSAAVAEEARYYEAECLRLQAKYPKAADTYVKMLNDFPSGAYREQALQHIFDIANYWLDDTRKGMELAREKREGKRWWTGTSFFHWDKSKPLMDEEGRAIEKLEQVRYNDMTGPLADKSLFLMGSVSFFNENYRDADHYFSQLVEMHPNSQYAAQGVELAIISKHMSTGGSDYDGRRVSEARQLVHTALHTYPELAAKKTEFLERQLIGITVQQAEKDYKVAEFYRRTGHPESAYFYYEIVRRRYPGTKFHELATQRMHELHADARSRHKEPPPAPEVAPNAGSPTQLPAPREANTLPAPRPLPPDDTQTLPAPRPLP